MAKARPSTQREQRQQRDLEKHHKFKSKTEPGEERPEKKVRKRIEFARSEEQKQKSEARSQKLGRLPRTSMEAYRDSSLRSE